MKRVFITIILSFCQILCTLADDKSSFPNKYFHTIYNLDGEWLKSIYIKSSNIEDYKRTIPIDTVARYLVQVANNVEFYGSDCSATVYQAVTSYKLENNRFLVYKVIRPGNIVERYMCDWTGKPGYPVTLLIYKSVAGKVEIYPRLKFNKLTIIYNFENPPFFPVADIEVYELSSGFPLLYSSFPNQTTEK